MDLWITIIGFVTVLGVPVILLRRKLNGKTSFGFKIPGIGGGVYSFGEGGREEAQAAAEDFVREYKERGL